LTVEARFVLRLDALGRTGYNHFSAGIARRRSNTMIELRALVNDLGMIEKRLGLYELKYGVLSNEFYGAFANGELAEFDAHDDYRHDFLEWAALCQTRQKLEQAYQRLVSSQSTAERIRKQLALAA
jgi:hypothetical protein